MGVITGEWLVIESMRVGEASPTGRTGRERVGMGSRNLPSLMSWTEKKEAVRETAGWPEKKEKLLEDLMSRKQRVECESTGYTLPKVKNYPKNKIIRKGRCDTWLKCIL